VPDQTRERLGQVNNLGPLAGE